jgi:hypothetical protein
MAIDTTIEVVGDPPPVLYHYTSRAGLLGIVEHRCLWASHILYLNDSTEYNYAVEMYRKVVGDREAAAAKVEKELHSRMLERIDLLGGMNVFVLSLTANGDLLSQWRAYADNGTGYCVGICVDNFLARQPKHSFTLAACIYDENVQRKEVELIVDQCVKEFNTPSEFCRKYYGRDHASLEDRIHHAIFSLPGRLIALAPRLKHPSFREEAEWRLYSAPLSIEIEEARFRVGASLLVPYYAVPLPYELGNPEKHRPDNRIIDSIRIGPSPHPSLGESSVRILLQKHIPGANVNQVDIAHSCVPYRSW